MPPPSPATVLNCRLPSPLVMFAMGFGAAALVQRVNVGHYSWPDGGSSSVRELLPRTGLLR